MPENTPQDEERRNVADDVLLFVAAAEALIEGEEIEEVMLVILRGQIANAKALDVLHRKVDSLMADITQLTEAISNLETVEGAAVTELNELATELASLNTTEAPTQEQLDSLTARATAVATALSSATTAAEGGAPAGGGEPPAPGGGEGEGGGAAPTGE